MGAFTQNLRYGLRMLGKNPSFTAAAVLCLALGIGATTAIFSVVNAVLLRQLPYANADRLVRVFTEFPNFPNGGLRHFWVSPPEFLDSETRRYRIPGRRRLGHAGSQPRRRQRTGPLHGRATSAADCCRCWASPRSRAACSARRTTPPTLRSPP